MTTTTQTAATRPIFSRKPLLVRIPFLTTTFSTDLYLYALLWPLWWLIGIEQLLLPFFIVWELLRYLWQSQLRFRLNWTVTWVFLLAVWWIVPIIWVDREYLDIFLKEAATAWSQFFFLFLFWNGVRTEKAWKQGLRAVEVLAAYIAIGGLIFLSGIWRGDLLSVAGRLLPTGLIESSAFFESISYRTFGTIVIGGAVFTQRISSFSLTFSDLSMVCLFLIPVVAWRFLTTRGWGRIISGFVVVGLMLCLIFAGSRIAYIAFAAQLGLLLVLRLDLLHGKNKWLAAALSCVIASVVIAVVYLAYSLLGDIIGLVFVDVRPGSWLVRFNIYRETWRLLWDHPIAGWGVPVRIPYLPTIYSAGTHSSYLGVIFKHGFVGLFLYIGLWLSIWHVVIRGLRQPAQTVGLRGFWIAAAAAFFALNIREAADSWWWDQLIVFAIWLIWGLVLTAPKVFANSKQFDKNNE
jgi:hypothetical protein